MNKNSILEIRDLNYIYKKSLVLKNITFEVKKGEIVSILGSSGSGKSTLLKAISGVERVEYGQIFLDNIEIASKNKYMRPEKREIGLVFQELALFPHLNIQQNIEYGITSKNKVQRREITLKMLELIKMSNYCKYYPHMLSGGQQQRVALARALAAAPKILLLDEPFSGLDINLRKNLAKEMIDILRSKQITSIIVTHDAHESLMISDKIVIIKDGMIEQCDTPISIYNSPNSLFVAEFFGVINKIKINKEVLEKYLILNDLYGIKLWNNFIFCFRPEALSIKSELNAKDNLYFYGKIINIQFFGSYLLVIFSSEYFGNIIGQFNSRENFSIGDIVHLEVNIKNIFCFQIN